MDSTAKKLNYQDSVAYDLSRFDKRKRVREALENQPVAVPAIRPRGTTAAKAKSEAAAAAKTRGLSVFSVVSYIAVFALFMLIVMNYMKINELSVEQSALSRELAALKSEAAQLEIKYEQKINMYNIEERAAELGLSKPTQDQIQYIDIAGQDYAVVYNEDTGTSGFIAGIKSIFMSVLNFFE